MDIYSKIKQKRLQLGLSQDDLALKTGYKDRSSIAKIEKGKVDLSISKVKDFAKVLKTTPAYLMGFDVPMEIEKSKNLKSVEDLDFSGINRIAAHFEGDEFSEDDLNEIQNFINYVKQKNKNKEK